MIEESIAKKLYNGRRRAVKKGELNLNEFSSDITQTEKDIITNIIPSEYKFLRCNKSQIIFQKNEYMYSVARFGCDDEIYDGIKVNKKEIDIAYEYQHKNIFPYPEEYSIYVFKTKYIMQINNTDLPTVKKTGAFTYITDIIDDIDRMNAFKLTRSQIGYHKQENKVYILDYGHLIK